ncbi:hypothetical protein C8A05DRAFT_35158 [Staphylotrichum tortipilum]|uniref:Chitin-binding type-2 domain-containing protein n=1 Tax=Staphylotrichum tortipilum TaxID=2831512 RepID=A0AAN6RSS6_9PEZI|nr:hypothetical protein C8A05DRAFT_35158 [Staphylotrichum longicolle]
MKVFAILAALATAALAADNMAMNAQEAQGAAEPAHWPPHPPYPRPRECHPGTYSCTPNHRGWRVCDWSDHRVFVGWCSPSTTCKFNWQNGSPYCVPRH